MDRDRDDLLERIAATAREEDAEEASRLDRRWEALAAGTLPPAEAAALRAEAERTAAGRQALAAFRPLGRDFRERTRDEILGRLGASDREADRPAPWGRLRWAAAGAVLLAAASLLVVLRLGAPPPLPGYSLALSGAVRALRSPEAPSLERRVFVAGNRFELVLTPEAPAVGSLELRAFVERGSRLSTWSAPVEVSPQGAARLTGTVGREVLLEPGESILIIALGRPGSLPTASTLRRRLAGRDTVHDGGWVAWRVPITLADEAPPP